VHLVGQDLLREAPGKLVMVSKASEPQISADMESQGENGVGAEAWRDSGIEEFDRVAADLRSPATPVPPGSAVRLPGAIALAAEAEVGHQAARGAR
jgi:hypothetical protein